MPQQTRYFADLEARPRDELDSAAMRRRRSYARVVYGTDQRPRSATLMVAGRVEGVRWFATGPSPALHAEHCRRHDGLPYSICHDEGERGHLALLRSIWEVLPSGEVWAREMRWYADGVDGRSVETWRYDGASGPMCVHTCHELGRLVRGEEYRADGNVHRVLEELLQ
jgi:hypothetical protein